MSTGADTVPRPIPRYRLKRRAFIVVTCALALAGVLGAGIVLGSAFLGKSNVFGTASWSQMRPEFSAEVGGDVLVRPVGIAVSDRKIFVTDSALGGVALFTRRSGKFERLVGHERLEVPIYCAADEDDDRLYVSDRRSESVLVFRLSGSFVETLTIAAAAASADETPTPVVPLGVSVAGDGSLLVTDVGAEQRVVSVSPDDPGNGREVFTGTDTELLSFPNAVRESHDGLWVSDSNNRRLIGVSATGDVFRQYRTDRIARGFDIVEPQHDIGLERRFLVVEATDHSVVVLDDDGTADVRIGGLGGGEGELFLPNDVAVASDGTVYVADTGNARIQSWTWVSTSALGMRPDVSAWIWFWVALLLAPLALLILRRPIRIAITPDVLGMLDEVAGGAFEPKRRIELLVTPASVAAAEVALGGKELPEGAPGDAARHESGRIVIQATEVSPTDVSALLETANFDRGGAEALALASRTRILASEDKLLAEAARLRGHDVFDACGFVAEFGRERNDSCL